MKFSRNILLASFTAGFMSLAQVGAAEAHDKTVDVAGAFTRIEGVPDFGWVTLSSQTKSVPPITIKLIPGAVARDVWFTPSPASNNKLLRDEANIVSAYMAYSKNQCGQMTVEADPTSPGLKGSVVTLETPTF